MQRQKARLLLYHYLSPFVLVAIALLVDVAFHDYFGGSLLFLPLAAIALAALIGGYGPGLIAIILSVVGLDTFLLKPAGLTFHLERVSDQVRILLFIPAAFLLTWLSGALRNSRERAEQANSNLLFERELRERFVSAMSHDLRNPLSAAKIGIELSLRPRENETSKTQALRSAATALDRVDRMVQDLLDANRINAGQPLPLKQKQLDLIQLVQDSLGELTMRFGRRFDFKTDIGFCEGRWDRLAVTRILENLVTNAIKYGTKEGKVTIRINNSNSHVFLSVNNQGNPIPQNEIPNLFTLFRRLEATRADGWGIGLYLVKGLAQAHGGTITVASNESSGTTFTVTLPLNQRKDFTPSHRRSV